MCTSGRSALDPFDVGFPQLFPGLIYRMIKPKVVLLIFVSGKIVLTGAKVCTNFPDPNQTYRSIDMGVCYRLLLVRFGRRSTRLSTRFTLCSANSASHEHLVVSRCSLPDSRHYPSHTRPLEKPCPSSFSMQFLPGDGLSADACMM